MKKGETAKKAEKLTIFILVLSIISLILMSLLPWISVAENDLVKEDLHFNFEMMKKSSNEQIGDLASDLNLINISFWALIILSLLLFLGATIHASGKISVAGHILLLIGCVTFIFSIFVIVLQLINLENIGEMNIISASAIYSPMNYAYILLIPSLLIFICSASYTWAVFAYSIQKFKSSKKTKKDKKEKPALGKTSLEPKIDEKRVEMEQWLTGQVQDIEKQAVEEKRPEPEKEKTLDIEEEEQEKISQEPYKESKEMHIFPPEKTKEETEEPDEVRASQSFEETLSSAIQKKQTGVISKEGETSEEKEEISPQIEEEPAKKTFSVICPQCKHIFTVEKEEGITKIKCPECGKEGVIK